MLFFNSQTGCRERRHYRTLPGDQMYLARVRCQLSWPSAVQHSALHISASPFLEPDSVPCSAHHPNPSEDKTPTRATGHYKAAMPRMAASYSSCCMQARAVVMLLSAGCNKPRLWSFTSLRDYDIHDAQSCLVCAAVLLVQMSCLCNLVLSVQAVLCMCGSSNGLQM